GVAAGQLAAAEAIASELGAIVARVVTKPLGGPWRVAIHVPMGRASTVSRIVSIAHNTLTRAGASAYELVLTPEPAPVRPLPVVGRPTRRLQAASRGSPPAPPAVVPWSGSRPP